MPEQLHAERGSREADNEACCACCAYVHLTVSNVKPFGTLVVCVQVSTDAALAWVCHSEM